jgi:hypothetical protein
LICSPPTSCSSWCLIGEGQVLHGAGGHHATPPHRRAKFFVRFVDAANEMTSVRACKRRMESFLDFDWDTLVIGALPRAQPQGHLSAAEVATWLAPLESASRAGRFFGALEGPEVPGRLPRSYGTTLQVPNGA